MAFQIQRFSKKAKLRLVQPDDGAAGPVLAPASVYLLADNLDAALAAGEDLLSSSIVWNAASAADEDGIAAARETQAEALAQIRSLEMILVARVLKSRERAEELGHRDERFEDLANLYTSGTATLIEATSEFADATVHDFETGDAPIAYLRTRELIASDTAAPLEGATLYVDESFLIARRIELGALLDLVAMFLDTLEIYYDLFVSGPEVDDAEIDGL
ncbi:MAG: hypothetical protein ABL894_07630 [Hyphomicrobium sp.]